MATPLYLDTARFGPILPECAEMLREFASLLESEGQFPHFEEFLHQGSVCWPDRLTSRFPTLARWQGLPSLRRQVLSLCGIACPATVLFASASRHMVRVAFHMLSNRCERVLSCDSTWPEYHKILKKQMVQSDGQLYCVQFSHPFLPDDDRQSRESRLAADYRQHRCDGALITSVSADGALTKVDSFLDAISNASSGGYFVVDGSQQAGHLPIDLGPCFRGFYLAGTHKWLRSGVPLSFGVAVDDGEQPESTLAIRKAIRSSRVDDSIMLQTADVGLDCPRQTTRLEPLLAASLAIHHALENSVQEQLRIRHANALHILEIINNLCVGMSLNGRHGIVEVRLRNSQFTASEIQQQFAVEGLTLSVSGEQRLRISCPATEFTESELENLWRIFGQLADRYCEFHEAESDPDGCHSVA